jgi:acyl-CoA thioesterase-2
VPDSPTRFEESIIALLTLEPAGHDTFLAETPNDGMSRLFGGLVASQSLRAATLTVDPDRYAHSVHAYFIRPGRPDQPLELAVDRTRDGRSFTTRRVTASQDGEPIFVLAASFHIAEPGFDWQLPAPSPSASPDALGPDGTLPVFGPLAPLEVRPLQRHDQRRFMTHPVWMRSREPLPDDPAMHACVITYMSDLGVVSGAKASTDDIFEMTTASLDHALWLHRPVRADEWLLFTVDPVSNFGSRGLARGTMHTEDGVLVASLAQEALLRAPD